MLPSAKRSRHVPRPGIERLGMKPAVWKHWEQLAQSEIEATLSGLPEPLQVRARALPVVLERLPSARQMQEGIEPDTLGLFLGAEYHEQAGGENPLPPQILLFLENLWLMTGGEEAEFRAETRTTFLHELGHYLGLDEDELSERGLE